MGFPFPWNSHVNGNTNMPKWEWEWEEYTWQWEWEWLLFHLCQKFPSVYSTSQWNTVTSHLQQRCGHDGLLARRPYSTAEDVLPGSPNPLHTSSAASERVFSAAGRLLEKRRTNLAPDSVNSLLFLNSNMWHFIVCWRQYDTDSRRQVDILKLGFLTFCIFRGPSCPEIECLHFGKLSSFNYSVINVVP